MPALPASRQQPLTSFYSRESSGNDRGRLSSQQAILDWRERWNGGAKRTANSSTACAASRARSGPPAGGSTMSPTDPVFARPVALDRRALRSAGRSRRIASAMTCPEEDGGDLRHVVPHPAQPGRSRQAPAVDEGLGRSELRPARPLAGFPQHRADGLGRERRFLRPARRAVRRQRPQLLQASAATATCSPPTPSSIRRPTAPRARTSRPTSSPISAWSRKPRTA